MPITNPAKVADPEFEYVIAQHEISTRLKTFKKPKSQVVGDIHPELVTKFHDMLAVPLAYVFNLSLATRAWPDLWKAETVSIIPKTAPQLRCLNLGI